jgi:hypothetical protein
MPHLRQKLALSTKFLTTLKMRLDPPEDTKVLVGRYQRMVIKNLAVALQYDYASNDLTHWKWYACRLKSIVA